MRDFTFNLFARYPDGAVTPLKGSGRAVGDGADTYVCAFDCPLIGGGAISAPRCVRRGGIDENTTQKASSMAGWTGRRRMARNSAR